MHRLAAIPLLASLIAAGTVSAAPAQTPSDGTCYTARPLPALPSGTRVFARPTLLLHRAPAASPAPHAESPPLRLEAPLATMQKWPGNWILTSGEPTNQVATPAEKGPVIVHTDASGTTMTIRPSVSLCAYPAGAPLPAYLTGVTPDIVIP